MKQIQVLIVDWYEAQARAIKYMFQHIPHEKYDFLAQTVVDTQQAEKLIQHNKYHLIMLHDPLSVVTGKKLQQLKENCFELIQQIKQSDLNSKSAVIVYAGGYFDMKERKRLKELGVVWMEGVTTLSRFQQHVEKTLDEV